MVTCPYPPFDDHETRTYQDNACALKAWHWYIYLVDNPMKFKFYKNGGYRKRFPPLPKSSGK